VPELRHLVRLLVEDGLAAREAHDRLIRELRETLDAEVVVEGRRVP
jgi:hypothetical protein